MRCEVRCISCVWKSTVWANESPVTRGGIILHHVVRTVYLGWSLSRKVSSTLESFMCTREGPWQMSCSPPPFLSFSYSSYFETVSIVCLFCFFHLCTETPLKPWIHYYVWRRKALTSHLIVSLAFCLQMPTWQVLRITLFNGNFIIIILRKMLQALNK